MTQLISAQLNTFTLAILDEFVFLFVDTDTYVCIYDG